MTTSYEVGNIFEKTTRGKSYLPKVLYRKIIEVFGEDLRYKIIDVRGFVELEWEKIICC